MYERRDHVPISKPIFSPLFSTIVTPRYVIRQTVTDVIHRNNRNVIWYTDTLLFLNPRSSMIASFVLNKLTHVPLYQLYICKAQLNLFQLWSANGYNNFNAFDCLGMVDNNKPLVSKFTFPGGALFLQGHLIARGLVGWLIGHRTQRLNHYS